jgi:hypothetical protein
MKEKHILYIGTPHIKDTFVASPLKKVLAYILYFALSDLAKDALNSPDIKNINK